MATPLLNDPAFQEAIPDISPDGRWLAYTSNRTGRSEVYVSPFPDVLERRRVQVSDGGGNSPRWGVLGAELLYLGPGGAVVSASLDPVTGAVLGRETLFTVPGDGWIGRFEVALDGRLLMARQRPGDDPDVPQVVVVQNFIEELRRVVRE